MSEFDKPIRIPVVFKRVGFWGRLRARFDRRYREAWRRNLDAGIRYLVEHPEAPCEIDGVVILDGYGTGAAKVGES
jgi:hypothetical protein